MGRKGRDRQALLHGVFSQLGYRHRVVGRVMVVGGKAGRQAYPGMGRVAGQQGVGQHTILLL